MSYETKNEGNNRRRSWWKECSTRRIYLNEKQTNRAASVSMCAEIAATTTKAGKKRFKAETFHYFLFFLSWMKHSLC